MIHLALTIASALFLGWIGLLAFGAGIAIIAATWKYILGALAVIAGILIFVSLQADPKPTAAVVNPQAIASFQGVVPAPVFEDMRPSIQTVLSSHASTPPVPVFVDSAQRIQYLRWLEAMARSINAPLLEGAARIEFLQTVWYESRRAGLNPSLVLALIQTASSFRRFHVADNGARGYMAVHPEWSRLIGDSDASKLFILQVNLRYGLTILRHYLDAENGDVESSLRDYGSNSMALDRSDRAVTNYVDQVLENQRGLLGLGAASSPSR